MSGLTRTDMRALVAARKRPLCEKLGDLPFDLQRQLIDFHRRNAQANIVEEALKNRSQRRLSVENPDYLSGAYAQIALQIHPDGQSSTANADRRTFVQPVDVELVSGVSALIGPSYRMRISSLAPGGSIPRHVDDPRQVRVISLLSGEQIFDFYQGDKVKTLQMRPGELWLINTAFEHCVHNPGKTPRLALLANLFAIPNSETDTSGLERSA
ncbi:Aspartyl/Asparaginyl beta-hydroxylase [Roseibium album]|nr:Aspartyl/Asparaginyl beta-hydroxylase [Roseibium album]